MGKFSKYEPYDENFEVSSKEDSSAHTFRPRGQKTNYPHTTISMGQDGQFNDYHWSESPKGAKFGLRDAVSGAISVIKHVNDAGKNSYDHSRESDINDRGIDI